MSKKAFFVQSGNWCVKLHVDVSTFDNKPDVYTELGTRALETIFGVKDFNDEEDDYYAIMNEEGVNVFTLEDLDDLPTASFSVNTYILSMKNDEPHKLLATLRTSDLFANASQFDNHQFALEAEKQEKKLKDKENKKKKKP